MDIIALDFDGVICNSAGEICASGWKAAGRLWPRRFEGEVPGAMVAAFERVRPAMSVGYQSILLVRLLRDGYPEEKILADPVSLFSALMDAEGLTRDALMRRFGRIRDDWMAKDMRNWIGAHRFYEGTVDAVNCSDLPRYIITTKEKRFALALCNAAGLNLPVENIFGLESGKKLNVLAGLRRRHPQACIHFIEDRLNALLCAAEDKTIDLQLYFAAWGCHTDEELARALRSPRITVLDLAQFPRFVQMPAAFA
ncbi:MAG: hypothetical protein P8X96_06030 [Desulfobacteraceae bacterium]|jgi:phosphoglycolate phosphatase-like HAD superfamily hydrolase